MIHFLGFHCLTTRIGSFLLQEFRVLVFLLFFLFFFVVVVFYSFFRTVPRPGSFCFATLNPLMRNSFVS